MAKNMTVYAKDKRNWNLRAYKKTLPMPSSVNWLPEGLVNL